MERVVDPALLVFRQASQIDVSLREAVQQIEVDRRRRLLFANEIRQPLLLRSLLGDQTGELRLDARAPGVVEVGVAGRGELAQFCDQVVLPLLQFGDLGGQSRFAGGEGGVGGPLFDGG